MYVQVFLFLHRSFWWIKGLGSFLKTVDYQFVIIEFCKTKKWSRSTLLICKVTQCSLEWRWINPLWCNPTSHSNAFRYCKCFTDTQHYWHCFTKYLLRPNFAISSQRSNKVIIKELEKLYRDGLQYVLSKLSLPGLYLGRRTPL